MFLKDLDAKVVQITSKFHTKNYTSEHSPRMESFEDNSEYSCENSEQRKKT